MLLERGLTPAEARDGLLRPLGTAPNWWAAGEALQAASARGAAIGQSEQRCKRAPSAHRGTTTWPACWGAGREITRGPGRQCVPLGRPWHADETVRGAPGLGVVSGGEVDSDSVDLLR